MQNSKNTEKTDYILIGKIRGIHGIKGWLKVESLSDNPERFRAGSRMIIEQNGRELVIEDLRETNGRYQVKFIGVDDRAAADLLHDQNLVIDRKMAGKLPEDTWYYWQLEGLRVYENGALLGEITSVYPGAANDNYVMKKPDGREILIPAIKSVIKKVDLEAGIMEVSLLPGLDD